MTKNKPPKVPHLSAADIAKAEARAKALSEYANALDAAAVQLEAVAQRFQANDPNVAGLYATGKEDLRALTKAYNRLSLFLDQPPADPRFATTVSMPVPQAVRDAKPPTTTPAPEPVDDAFRDDERDMALERRLEAERDADHDRP